MALGLEYAFDSRTTIVCLRGKYYGVADSQRAVIYGYIWYD